MYQGTYRELAFTGRAHPAGRGLSRVIALFSTDFHRPSLGFMATVCTVDRLGCDREQLE